MGCYSLPTFVDLTDEILKRNYISEFDKTIVLKHPNEVFELKILKSLLAMPSLLSIHVRTITNAQLIAKVI